MSRWIVSEKDSGQSLQAFLKSHLGQEISAKKIKRVLDAGRCTLNGRVERFGTRLVGKGDKIECASFGTEVKPAKSGNGDRILYLDDDLIAFNKPPGMASDSKSLAAELLKYGPVKLLHRLDKETSGILLFARNENTAKAIEGLFKQRKMAKTYYAIVDGIPKASTGVIENFLGKLKVYEGQTLWGEVSKDKGLISKTKWQLKTPGKTASLVICYPETGRTHQIRVHLSSIGHPILGDMQYGRRFKSPYKAPRVLLHAYEIEFIHPHTGKSITIKAPLPDDFAEALNTI